MNKRYDWDAIQRSYDRGCTVGECRKAFGITFQTWAKAVSAGRLRLRPGPFADGRKRFDWQAIQADYDRGRTFYQCMERFGFSRCAWHKAVRRGEIRPRPLGRPLAEIVRGHGSRANVKRRLLKSGLLQNRCQECGLTEWLGSPLSIQIDHVNGVRDDHRLENLRMLCPNCHSQTETFGHRRRPNRQLLQDPARVV